jgi:hypothetical protein
MSAKEQPSTALAVRAPQAVESWRGVEWQRLWLSLQSKPWTALALVPASRGAPVDFTLTMAVTLARTGILHLGAPVHVADGTQVELSRVIEFTEEIKHYQAIGDRILIALGPIEDDPIAETLAQAADRLLLCVLFESMSFGESKRTVKKVGKDRFLGSTIVRRDDLKR